MSEAALPASQMRGAPPAAVAPPSDAVHAKGKQSQFRLITACSLGNALEMYDFTVYSFFALLIGKLFFPSDSPYGSLLLAVATFGIGFVMRPLGGVKGFDVGTGLPDGRLQRGGHLGGSGGKFFGTDLQGIERRTAETLREFAQGGVASGGHGSEYLGHGGFDGRRLVGRRAGKQRGPGGLGRLR